MEHDRKVELARARGAALEHSQRSGAFLRGPSGSDFPEKICGIEVVPLTLRIMGRLRAARSPFMVGGRIQPGHIAAFLWAVSPGYALESSADKKLARQKLVERAAALPFARAREGIRKYLFLAWMDRPPVRRSRKDTLSSVSFEAAMIHHIAHVYHWDDEQILDKPIKRLYQYLTMIRIEGDQKAVTFNPIVDRLVRRLKR